MRPAGLDVNNLSTDVANVVISSPTNVQHKTHTTFQTRTGRYEGLPKEWEGEEATSTLAFGASVTGQPRVALSGFPDRVPTILVLLGRDLRRRAGFGAEGLFRIAPSRTEQSRVRSELGCSTSPQSTQRILEACEDPHVVAALIKEWCRTLDGSVLGELDGDMLSKLSEEDLDNGPPSTGFLESYRRLLFGEGPVSTPKRAVLLWVLDLMGHVVREKEVNRMGMRAVATCFAPSLFVPREAGLPPMQQIQQIKFVTTVLVNAQHVLTSFDTSPTPRDMFGDQSGAFS